MVKFINFIGGLISKTVVSTSSITGDIRSKQWGTGTAQEKGNLKRTKKKLRIWEMTCSIPLENGLANKFTLMS